MESESGSDEGCERNEQLEKSTKKRKIHGPMKDVMKKLRLASHETGSNCACKHLKCFDVVVETERRRIIAEFNNMRTKDDQDSYLGGLITVLPVKRRRP